MDDWYWCREMFIQRNIFYMRNKEDLDRDFKRISKYILRKLDRRRYQRRPMELKYLHIAKATQSTYKQIRRVFDIMTETKILTKYRAWERLPNQVYVKRNFYTRYMPPPSA